MRALKSIVRGFFAIQAAILLLIPLAALFGGLRTHLGFSLANSASAQAHHSHARLIAMAIIAGMFACGLLFAVAWWTTRKAEPDARGWAIAASIVNLGEGMVALLAAHLTRGRLSASAGDGLWCIALGVTGLFLFARNKTGTASTAPVEERKPVAGDRTSLFARNAVNVISWIAQIAAIVFWSHWAFANDLFRIHGLAWIALILLASLLTTMIHECGHALIAWCFEMSLLSFKAGPFQWVKREGKWAFKLRMAGLLTPGGAVGAVSNNPSQPRWEEILMIASGSLANVLIGIPAVYAVLHDDWPHYQQTWELIAFTGSFCIIGAILNLVPFMSEEGAYSDGARILQIVTNSPLEEYHKTIASIASTATTEVRYRDLDVAAIQRAAKLFPEEFRGLHLNLCACHCFEDASRFPEAAAALANAESIYDNFAVDLPAPLHTVFIIGHAYLNRNAAAARKWWERMEAKNIERQNVDYWLAKTALLWIEGDINGAEQAWFEADSLAQTLPKFGAYEFDRFRCFLLRQALNESKLASEKIPDAVEPISSYLQPIVRTDTDASSPILPAWITPSAATAVAGMIASGDALDARSGIESVPSATAVRPPNVQPNSYSDSASMFARLSTLTARPATETAQDAGRSPNTEAGDDVSIGSSEGVALARVDESEPGSRSAAVGVHTEFLDWGKTVGDDPNARMSTALGTSFEEVSAEPSATTPPATAMCSARPIAPPPAGTASITPLPVEKWTTVPSVAAPSLSVPAEPLTSVIPMPDCTGSALPSPIAKLPIATAIQAPNQTAAPMPFELANQNPAKGPSVPAAFARKPRVVGPIPEFSFSTPVIAEASATESEVADGLVSEASTPVSGSTDADVATISGATAEAASIQPLDTEQDSVPKTTIEQTASVPKPMEAAPVVPPPAPVEATRFDPLAFIRAAAIENLSTS